MILGYSVFGRSPFGRGHIPGETGSSNPWAPMHVIAGWHVLNEDTIRFPITDVALLDAAESDAAGGDSRHIFLALIDQWYQWYDALDTADKPEQLDMQLIMHLDESSGLSVLQYWVGFNVTRGGLEVSAE